MDGSIQVIIVGGCTKVCTKVRGRFREREVYNIVLVLFLLRVGHLFCIGTLVCVANLDIHTACIKGVIVLLQLNSTLGSVKKQKG